MIARTYQHPYDPKTTCMEIPKHITPFFSGSGHLDRLYGPDGKAMFKRWGWFWSVPLYTFRQGKPPLTFHDCDGTAYQPDNHFDSDCGSIPPPLWGIPFVKLNPVAWERSYPLHDSLFQYGGLYVRRYGEKHFHFERLNRVFGDGLLRRMVIAEGAGRIDAGAIRFGVWVGSRFAWDEEAQSQNRVRDGIKLEISNG